MLEKPSKLMPAVYGGIVMGVISGIPFLNFINCLCCAGVLLGGFLAVFFYNKDLASDMALTNGDALQLGALAGVIGAVVGTLIGAILIYTVGNISGEAMYGLVYDFYDSMGLIDQMSPDQLDQLETMKADELSMTNIISAFIIYPLFGLLGGLIGYSVYKKKPTMTNTPPAQTTGV
ncbi:MAG: hypothetical protein ACKVRP_00745 [Bacteroidota bacterium]